MLKLRISIIEAIGYDFCYISASNGFCLCGELQVGERHNFFTFIYDHNKKEAQELFLFQCIKYLDSHSLIEINLELRLFVWKKKPPMFLKL